MHSFVQMNGQHRQVGPSSQAAPHPPNDATRSWSANNVHLYMTANSGVQPSQNVYFASQNGVYPNRQMANLQSSEGLPLVQSKNGILPITCGSQISTLQHSRQYSVNQSLPSPSNPNTTYSMQNMTGVCWSQSATVNEKLKVGNVDVPHLQQNRDARNFYPCSTKSNSSYTTPCPSLFQLVNSKAASFVSAAPQNVQTSQRVSNQNFRPSCVESGPSSVYTQNCSMGTSQSFGSNSAAPQSFSNGQVVHFSNTSQMTQQSATLINSSYYNCDGSTNSGNASLNDQNNSNSFLRDANELPINSAGAQQQMLRNQGSADSLGNSHAISNGYCLPPPPPYESRCVDKPRMSNQNIQPVTSARSESYNLNAFQPPSLHSKQSLPQNVMSRGHLTVNPHPQQNTLPEAFNVNTAEDGGEREKAVNVSLPNGNAVSKRYVARSPSDGPQVQQTPKKMSTQRNDLHAVFKNHPYLLQILGFHPMCQYKDSSANSGKAHTSTRAVAVVPPLSQDDGQTSNSPTCNSINGMDKERITPDVEKEAACVEEDTNLDQEMLNPVRANQAASNEVAVLINSCCESQSSPQSSEQHNPTAQRCSECSPSQTSPGGQSETASPPSPPVFELSSLPTNSWTMKALNDLISATKTSKRKSKDNIIKIILDLFWDKNIQAFLRSYTAAFQTEFFSDIEKVCAHFKQDTVILSQVKPKLNDPLKQFHVLKDDEVYSEQPYKSFWLNLNDQLDDIDKDFGFPWALTQNHFVQDAYSQINIDNSILEPVANEVQNKVPSQPEPESTEAPPVVDSSTPPMSPDESEDASNDLRYSFKIEVLPSEEAKALYEKAQMQIDQGACEELMILNSSSQTEKDNNTHATLTSKAKNKSFQQIKEICCLSKLMEMYSLPVESPCRCLSKEERSCNGINNTTLNPDAENSPKGKDNDTITLTSPQLLLKLDQIIDFLDDDNNFLSPSSEMSPAISQISSRVNTDSNSDNEDKDIFATVPDISNEIINVLSEDESPEELESTETIQTSPSVSGTKQKLCSTETEIILLSDEEEDYEQTFVKAAEEAASPLESKGKIQTTYQTSFSPHVGDEEPKEREKRRSSPDQFFPGQKTLKKCKSPANLDPLDVPEAQPAASEKKTVELVLFGSGQQERGSLSGNEKISPQRVSCFKDNPPEVLSVNMCPSRRIHSEGGRTENYSVKQLIYERWRKSVPTLNGSVISGCKKKLRRQKHLSASQSTSSKEEQQSESEFKTPDGKNKGSLKKRRSLSFLRRLDEAKRKRYSVTLGQLENREAKEVQDENIHVMPLQENIVLKFSVLPNTFSFKDGSNLMETTDPVSDETKLVEEKDQSPEKTSAKSKGMWSSAPPNQHQPLDAPKTVGLFYEYQKKYKEKTRSSSGDEIDKRT